MRKKICIKISKYQYIIMSIVVSFYSKTDKIGRTVIKEQHMLMCILNYACPHQAGLRSAVGSAYDCRSRGREFESQPVHTTFVKIDHEIISTGIPPFHLFKKGSCQWLAKVHVYSGLVNRLVGPSLPSIRRVNWPARNYLYSVVWAVKWKKKTTTTRFHQQPSNRHKSHLMRLWYLSHRRPAKAQASLRVRAVSPVPSLFAHMKYGSRRRVRPKIRHLVSLDGCARAFEEWVYGGRKVP